MSLITKVEPLEDYLVHIRLDNGNSVTLNMKTRLKTVRFGQLSDPIFFKEVTTDGHFIQWGNQIEISVSEMFQLAQK